MDRGIIESPEQCSSSSSQADQKPTGHHGSESDSSLSTSIGSSDCRSEIALYQTIHPCPVLQSPSPAMRRRASKSKQNPANSKSQNKNKIKNKNKSLFSHLIWLGGQPIAIQNPSQSFSRTNKIGEKEAAEDRSHNRDPPNSETSKYNRRRCEEAEGRKLTKLVPFTSRGRGIESVRDLL